MIQQTLAQGQSHRTAAASPWWRGAVIYQIYPRSFADSNGDGIGDLAGCMAHLDHVASLGVDGVWLSPFFASPMRDFGYDVADHCAIDPSYGSMEHFDALLARAHALGLKVLIDLVASHTSDLHPWFSESRTDRTNTKADWFVWADPKPDGAPPNNWQAVFGGAAWTWDARRRQYYLHNFLSTQPDLNLHNPAVQAAILNIIQFWLEKGVDGFRIDAINFTMHDLHLRDNPPSGRPLEQVSRPFDMQVHQYNQSHPNIVDFLERVRSLMETYPDRFTVAEVGGDDPIDEMKSFTAGDNRLNSAYSFEFLNTPALRPKAIVKAVQQWRADPNEGWPSWAFSNHDAPRCVSRWSDGRDDSACARVAMMVLLSIRGNAFIYQGEELGLPQAHVAFEDLQDWEAIANWPRILGRDGARTPMPWRSLAVNAGFSTAKPWLPVDPRHARLAVDIQTRDDASMLAFTRAAVAVRKGSVALSHGGFELLHAGEDVLAFARREGAERVVCVFNFGQQESAINAAWHNYGRILLHSAGSTDDATLEHLPAMSAVWIAP
jgi:alpha-glucosidase